MQTHYTNKGFVHIFILILIVLLGISGIILMGLRKEKKPLKIEQTFDKIVSITPTAYLLPEIDTSDWKSYKNNTSGFEFQYPPDLEMFLSDNANPRIDYYNLNIGFIPVGGDDTSYNMLDLIVTDEFKDLDSYLKTKTCNYGTAFETSDLSVGGIRAKKLRCNDSIVPVDTVVWMKDKYIFQFFLAYGQAHINKYSHQERQQLFDQILSTFKFKD